MNRRNFIKKLCSSFVAMPVLMKAGNGYKDNTFSISINGDLDDDLIILKATPNNIKIVDIHQMHNPNEVFKYNGDIYTIKHNPGYIRFNKDYTITHTNNEVYIVTLANEREEANIKERIRTHYKSEKLFFNKKLFFPDLMPEYNSVPNYPLWFGKDEMPRAKREDINGDTYNYYNLFENTTVPFGIIVPKSGNIKLYLYNQKNELMYTYEENIFTRPKRLKSNELKQGQLNSHPLIEINNILHEVGKEEPINNDYINTVVLEYENELYQIPMPYPIMYPNQIFGVSNE